MQQSLHDFLKFNKNSEDKIIVFAFYKFVALNNINNIKKTLVNTLSEYDLKGTILLANEGINGTIAGKKDTIIFVLNFLSSFNFFKDIEHKFSFCDKNPFLRMKVKLKKEIITIGDLNINPIESVGNYLEPEEWNDFLQRENSIVIDTRNNYEVSIGSFKNSINPNLKSFRDFPKWVKEKLLTKNISENTSIGMFCTGGIRCEKSTSYLKRLGFKNVYHLKGGILNYLQKIPKNKSFWRGECFVFDYRVSLSHGMKKGNFDMCFACRMPISNNDKKNIFYIEGQSCHHCYNKTTNEQKIRFNERQKQIRFSKKYKLNHLGPTKNI